MTSATKQIANRPPWPPTGRGRSVLCLVILAALGLFGYLSLVAGHGTRDAVQAGAADETAKQQVILLTGFEPFGEDRPANPSWEAIKELDGKSWHGYRLVCREAKVVWGAPLEQLSQWIDEVKPVAIFSFGQGRPGGFALESKAHNRRGGHRDNKGEAPARPSIVESGPEEVDATFNCALASRVLAEKGYPVRISTNAGRYLCEECLYTLEHLRTARKVPGTVSFCHVPPLGTTAAGTKVTVPYIHEFVKDLLETWYTMDQNKTALVAARSEEPPAKATDAREAEVRELINRYFKTWSDQDMKGYEACFMPEAVVQFIDGQGHLSTMAKPAFIASQRNYHRTSLEKTVEVPETVDIRFEQDLARVVVYWKLTAGRRLERGYDHYTLMKVDGGWRIVNLVFYVTSK